MAEMQPDARRVNLLGMALQAPTPELVQEHRLLYDLPHLISADACGPVIVGHEAQSSCWMENHFPPLGCCFLEVASPDFVVSGPSSSRPKTIADLAAAILKCAAHLPSDAAVDRRFADRRGCRVVYLYPRIAKTMATTIWLTQSEIDALDSYLTTTRED